MAAIDNLSEKEILSTIHHCLKQITDNKKRNKKRLILNLVLFVAYVGLMFFLIWVHKGDGDFSDFFKHLTEKPFYLRTIATLALCWFIVVGVHITLFLQSWQTAINKDAINSALHYIERKQREANASSIDEIKQNIQ